MTTGVNDGFSSPSLDEVSLAVRRLSDELEIRNLIAKVYKLGDHDPDLDLYGELFTDDAVWERADGGGPGSHTSTRLVGRNAIVADRRAIRRANVTGPNSRRRHLATTLIVEVGSDDTASAFSKFLAIRGSEIRPIIDAVGEYDDMFRRTDSGWRLSHRRYSILSVNDANPHDHQIAGSTTADPLESPHSGAES